MISMTYLSKVRCSCLCGVDTCRFVSYKWLGTVSSDLRASSPAPNAEQCSVFPEKPSRAKHHVTVSTNQFPLHLLSELMFIRSRKKKVHRKLKLSMVKYLINSWDDTNEDSFV